MDKIKNFYKVFQIGIELEGEFMLCPENQIKKWEIGEDCSLKGKGFLNELRTDVIESSKEEMLYKEDLKRLVPSNSKRFAEDNQTCGTHIHFSFKHKSPAWLFAFDTLRFEKFFIDRFLNTFKREKYQKRLLNDFCVTNLYYDSFDKKVSYQQGLSRITPAKLKRFSGEKFRAIASHQVMRGRGMEIRLFPCITTTKGLDSVLDFTKIALMDYVGDKQFKKEALILEKFHKRKPKLDDFDKLNALQQIVVDSLFYSRGMDVNSLSGEGKMIVMEIMKQNPDAFKK